MIDRRKERPSAVGTWPLWAWSATSPDGKGRAAPCPSGAALSLEVARSQVFARPETPLSVSEPQKP